MCADKAAGNQQPKVIGKPFKKGQSGNPKGRPKGLKTAFAETFVKALAKDFDEHGEDAIIEVRETNPAAYLKTITAILPKEINGNINHDHKHSYEPVSNTVEWITGMLGGTKDSEGKKPSTH